MPEPRPTRASRVAERIAPHRDPLSRLRAHRVAGLWGVPCYRAGEFTAWGQDRFWMLGELLRRGVAAERPRSNHDEKE